MLIRKSPILFLLLALVPGHHVQTGFRPGRALGELRL